MNKSKFNCLLLITLLFSCSKDLEQNNLKKELLSCDIPISLSANSVSEYAYYCEETNSQTLFIYTPQNWEEEAGLPCIIFFHGAADNAGQFQMQSKHFSARGMVAICVNHRFTIPALYTKDGLKDGHAAIRWVKENHLLLGVDINRIAISGSSSGGAVALSCYLRQDFNHSTDDLSISIKPDVMVMANPQIVDFLEIPADASDHPATIFFQGDADNLTPLGKLETYTNTVLSRGAPEIELIIYKGRGHGFHNYNVSVSDYENTLLRADSFLVEHGYLSDYIDKINR